MRTSALVGGAGVALVAVAAGGYFYAQNRVLAEVEASFEAIRAAGAIAAHGPVAVDLLKRGVTIRDVVIKPTGQSQVPDTAIKTVTLVDVALWSAEFAADRVELADVSTTVALGSSSTGLTAIRIPAATATKVKTVRVDPGPKTGPAAAIGDSTMQAVAAFAGLDIASLTMPTVDVILDIPMPTASRPGAQPTLQQVKLGYTYSDVVLDGVSGGRIGKLKFGKSEIKTLAGPQVVSGTVAETSIENLDLMPFFGIGLAARTAKNGTYAVQGKTTSGGYNLRMPDGGQFSTGTMTATGLAIDPTKASYAKLRELFTAITPTPGAPPTAAETQAFLAAMVSIYDGLEFQGIDMRDLHIAGPKSAPQSFDIRVGGISMSGYAQGKLREFRVDAVQGSAKQPGSSAQHMQLGSFSMLGFDLVRIMKFGLEAAAQPNRPPAPEKMFGLLASVEGIEVIDVSVPIAGTGQVMQVDQFKASWGRFVNDVPTDLRTAFKGGVTLAPHDPQSEILRSNGITSINSVYDAATEWIEAERAVRSHVAIDTEQIAALTADVRIGNVPRDAISFVPGQFAAKAPSMLFGGASLKLKDRGMVKLANVLLGGPPASALATLEQSLTDPARPSPTLSRILEGAGRFLGTPGQTLTIALKPRGGVTLGRFMPSPGQPQAFTTPADVLELFDAEVAVAP